MKGFSVFLIVVSIVLGIHGCQSFLELPRYRARLAMRTSAWDRDEHNAGGGTLIRSDFNGLPDSASRSYEDLLIDARSLLTRAEQAQTISMILCLVLFVAGVAGFRASRRGATGVRDD